MKYNKTLTVGKHSINYIDVGKGKNLLFLHGFGVPPNHHPVIEMLAKHYRVIAPDLYTLKEKKHHLRTIERDVKLIEDFCSEIGKHIVIGHSYGGLLAAIHATRCKNVENVVLIDPAEPVSYGINEMRRRVMKKRVKELLFFDGWKGFSFTIKMIIPFFYHMFKDYKGLKNLTIEIDEYKYEGVKVKKPTLLLYGSLDELFNYDVKFMKTKFSKLKSKSFVKKHDWIILDPELGYKEIKKFLR